MSHNSKYKADILLIGSFGHPNLGDELLLKGWIQAILKHHPDYNILVDCHTPSNANAILGDFGGKVQYQDYLWRHAGLGSSDALESFCHGSKLTISNNPATQTMRFMLARLSCVKLVHFIGGGYIRAGWGYHYSLLSSAVALKKKIGAKLSMSGQGFIPFDQNTSSLMLTLLDQFDHVSTRDLPSYEIIKDLSNAYHESHLDDTFLFSHSPLGKHEKLNPDQFATSEPGKIVVCIQGDISDSYVNNLLLSKIHDIYQATALKIYLTEFMPKNDLIVLEKLALIAPVQVVPFEQLLNGEFTIDQNDICIGTRFHFHLLAARAGARGIFGCADEYYRVKHNSLLEIGSTWQNIINCQQMPALLRPAINDETLCSAKNAEFAKIMSGL
jgi:polysaccharide pyruvyl transferase WcaK-like protein